MNILFVADVSIKDVIGGAERVLQEQTLRLAKKGHTVYIITRKLSKHTSEYENIQTVHEWRYEVDTKNFLTYLKSTIKNCQNLYKNVSKKISFDVINFHQPFSAFAINLLQKTKQIKKIYTCHSLSFEEYKSRSTKKNVLFFPFINLNALLRKIIEKQSLSKSEKIIVLSQFTHDKLINTHALSDKKIHIIPGGVDLFYFTPTEDKMAKRKKYHIPEDKFILFTVRNLVTRMGIENLIEAMRIISEQTSEIYLIIGGKGPLKEKFKAMIKNFNIDSFVRLYGFVPTKDLPALYQASDFFILPTMALEGFGLVTTEALACGIPVLGTPIGGTQEILGNFDKSFIFKDTTPQSVAKLILNKYNVYKDDPAKYNQLSKNCRKFVEENYSWDKNINLTENLFKQVVSTD